MQARPVLLLVTHWVRNCLSFNRKAVALLQLCNTQASLLTERSRLSDLPIVRMTGFEPACSCSQSKWASSTPHSHLDVRASEGGSSPTSLSATYSLHSQR